MANHLDPLTFPIRGIRLMEASAGTGKTYTIGALYLRLVPGAWRKKRVSQTPHAP